MTMHLPPARVKGAAVVTRAEFDVIAGHELRKSDREGSCLSLLWLWVDHRRPVALDRATIEGVALQGLADLLAVELRGSDVVGVIGGQELAILLPDTAADQLEIVRWHLSTAVAELDEVGKSLLFARLSSSIYEPGKGAAELAKLLANARDPLVRGR